MGKVVAYFKKKKSEYEVQYQDQSGEWISAAGTYKEHDLTIDSVYDSEKTAISVAQLYFNKMNKDTQVIEKESEDES